MIAPFDLVIWDCDGCLVDSEFLACGAAAEEFTRIGYPLSTEVFIDRFAGQSARDNRREIEKEKGTAFIQRIDEDRITARRTALFKKYLKPISGVAAAIDAIGLPVCVASGSEPERIALSLELTGLWDRFAGHIYSAFSVPNGKPAPDVFLFAADKMGVPPTRCLVIEDSVPGIQGAQNAGMRVFAYLGASHITPAWRQRVAATTPDRMFNTMQDLPALVADEGHEIR